MAPMRLSYGTLENMVVALNIFRTRFLEQCTKEIFQGITYSECTYALEIYVQTIFFKSFKRCEWLCF